MKTKKTGYLKQETYVGMDWIISCILVYMIYILLPMTSDWLPKVIRYVLFFLFFLLPWIGKQSYNLGIDVFTIACFALQVLFIILYFIGKWSGSGVPFYSFFLEEYLFWMPSLLMTTVHVIPKQKILLLRRFAFILIGFSIITTIIGNMRYPEVSRLLATTSPERTTYYKQNIGGYEYVYMLLVLIPGLFYIGKESAGLDKWLAILLVIGIFFVMIISQYTTAIILSSAAMIISFVISHKNRKGWIISIVLFLIIYRLFSQYIPSILSQAQAFFSEQGAVQLAERCRLLLDSINGKSASGDMLLRQNHYQKSIDAFLADPVFGSLINNGNVGGHSEILDILGSTGIIGFLVFLLAVFFPLVTSMYHVSPTTKFYNITAYIMFFVLCSINTAFFKEIGFALFLFPTLCYHQEKHSIEHKTNDVHMKYVRGPYR